MGEEISNKPTIWIVSTVILAIALVAFVAGSGITGNFLAGSQATATGDRAIAYINENLLSNGMTAKMINITESNGLWLMAFTVAGNNYTAYISKDGQLLLPQAIPIEQKKTSSLSFDAPDAEKPLTELFVMSFCPYGIEAEKAMQPVVNLLGSAATIEPHFIIQVLDKTNAERMLKGTGYTLAEKFLSLGDKYLLSLHGPNEAAEDVRQAVILKNYGQQTFWKYVSYVNANCSLSDINTCWKSAASAAGLSVSAIESKMATDGLAAMIADQALADKYKVSGSPTTIINGAHYSGGRTPESFKNAVCSGFETAPESCSQTLNDTQTSPSGGCE